jgi:hypothetical protein
MAGGDDSVMWLRVKDEDIDAAELLRVTVSKSITGSGKKRRTSFVCTGTLHKGKDDHMREYLRAQKKVKGDPRNDEGLQLELQRDMMANFRKQKREREADNLVDSEEDDDDGGEHPCFLHSPLLHSLTSGGWVASAEMSFPWFKAPACGENFPAGAGGLRPKDTRGDFF